MKTKNFPDKITRRRAEAFKRANGAYPATYTDDIRARCETQDTRFRRVHVRGSRPMVFS